jgi:toxin HigB-1
MIRSFRHKGLKEFFETGTRRGISPELGARIARRLDVLHAACELADIDAHGFNLHRLKGDRAGEWAIWVSGNWRISLGLKRRRPRYQFRRLSSGGYYAGESEKKTNPSRRIAP